VGLLIVAVLWTFQAHDPASFIRPSVVNDFPRPLARIPC
jgi:hypothetical protein